MSLVAPPTHSANSVAALTAALADLQIKVSAGDGKDVKLKTKEGEEVREYETILRYLSQEAGGLNGSQCGDVDHIQLATRLESVSACWLPYAGPNSSDSERENTRQEILKELEKVDGILGHGRMYMNGDELTFADVVILPNVLGLFRYVLGEDVRAGFPHVQQWVGRMCQHEKISSVVGEASYCSKNGWTFDPHAGIDPAKLAKKLAKQAEKEAKKAKAAAKAAQKAKVAEELAKSRAANESKKAKQKAEAEAKKAAEAAEMKAWIDAAKGTPAGQKKSVLGEMPKGYSPQAVEAAWYEWWEASGYFKADEDPSKEPFVMVIPPPNVTGSLHIGHALTNSIQDTIIRWRRMSGYSSLWVPGTDHAGIATQTVVEKKIHREMGKTRHDLGREGFLEEVWKYVDDYGHRITNQLRRLGSSLDWSKSVFTMDSVRSNAVNEAFVKMHDMGLIYRDNRLVNWCCKLKTAVSDIEVDYIDVPKRMGISVPGYDEPVEFGAITSFAYPYEDGTGEIVVATTRPETMFGDTAVAVHPDDERYKPVIGKYLVHPVNGRRIPVIADAELVDPEFGTGAVKITPAHDPNDFATGKRHNLEFINILDDNGCLNTNGTGQFAGQRRFDARVSIVEFLKEKGLFRGVEDNEMRLGICSRSKDVIEPVLKPQWWVSCEDMAAKACDAVRSKELEIIPAEYESTWFRWMENIRDWCISRQLWWGHRIPAYYIAFEDEAESGAPGAPSEIMTNWVIGRNEEEALQRAQEKYPGRKFSLHQDEDVLDTWFSSGLFPFSVFGWPSDSIDLGRFFPGALLETGHDILFFWVARMVMMSQTLTGKLPFKQVYLHSLVRDAHGRKMSKSLGNVIDPIAVIEGITLEDLHKTLLGGNLDPKEVEKAKAGQEADFPEGIEECGADALRFALVSYTSQGRDINLDIKRVVSYRYWCNKLWNAIRFAMMNLGESFVPSKDVNVSALPFAAKWILSRLSNSTKTIIDSMYAYDFATATSTIYSFWQYELCDIFIELAKPALNGDDNDQKAAADKLATREALYICLETGLRLLHPFMPFVTEELWQRLPGQANLQANGECPASLVIASYPQPQPEWENISIEEEMKYMMNVVTKTRALRSDYGLTREKPELFLSLTDESKKSFLESVITELITLTTSSTVTPIIKGTTQLPKGCGVAVVDDKTTIHLALAGVLDVAKEIEKLNKKREENLERIDQLQKRIFAPLYAEKTPAAVQQSDSEKLQKLQTELQTIEHHLEDMKHLLEE